MIFDGLPAVVCQDCEWECRAFRDLQRELEQLGRQHITETDGHQVFVINAEARNA